MNRHRGRAGRGHGRRRGRAAHAPSAKLNKNAATSDRRRLPISSFQSLMMTNERIEPNRQWLVKLTQGASTMLGLGQTAIAITRVIRKRDLGSLWELDPVAAPPKRVQRHLLGTVEQAVPSTSQDSMRDNERYSILRMQLNSLMTSALHTNLSIQKLVSTRA